MIGETGDDLHIALIECAHLPAVQREQAHGLLPKNQRRTDPSPDELRPGHRIALDPALFGLHIRFHDRPPARQDLPGQHIRVLHQPLADQAVALLQAYRGDQPQRFVFQHEDAGAVVVHDPRQLPQDLIENQAGVERRIDDAGNLLKGLREALTLLLGAKEACVFDRDARLVRNGLQQVEIVPGELARFWVYKRHHSHDTVPRQEGSADRGAGVSVLAFRMTVQPACIGERVFHERRFPILDHRSGQPLLEGLRQAFGGVVVHLPIVGQCAFDDPAFLIEHQDAAAERAHIGHGQFQHALQQVAQIQLAGELAADGIEQIQGGAFALGGLRFCAHNRGLTLWPSHRDDPAWGYTHRQS